MTNQEWNDATQLAARQMADTLIAESLARKCVQFAYWTREIDLELRSRCGERRKVTFRHETVYNYAGGHPERWYVTLERATVLESSITSERPLAPEARTPARPAPAPRVLRVVPDPQP